MDGSIYKLIFETAIEGVLGVDEHGKITFVNERIVDLFGYQRDELIGETLSILIPTNKRQNHEKYRQSFDKEEGKRFMGVGLTVEGQHKDGSLVPVEVGLNGIVHEGRRLTIALITDITERKAMEDELEKSYGRLENEVEKRTIELKEALSEIKNVNTNLRSEVEKRKEAELDLKKALNKEKELGELKSRFVTMASHEFRTPLSGILTSSSLIKRHLELGNKDKIESHLGKVNRSVYNLTGILNDFLSLEKLENNAVEVLHSTIDLVEFLDKTLEEMETILKSGQTFVKESNIKAILINTDPKILTTIVNNLISNAIKYSINDQEIKIVLTAHKDQVQIDVIDSGIGIPEKDRKHLFNQFFRAGNAVNIAGTGLGLHIVRKQVELLSGDVSYRPNKDNGSIFSVMLPKK